ncbi:hypothetical protein [Acinetobacter sp. HR7]|uniref:hypothetical protein n=1 Tax=Acinetobacter sp. HR7 TaxID=1509403 RepID=UPI000537CC7C|nr:hypothetical protein [Acinetobacter sp. HR7]KGT48402.1 hypothetical protein GW12_05530 [Acinetobacter sp. HR7]
MNTKSSRFNPNILGVSILSAIGAFSIGALAYESKPTAPQYQVHFQPAETGVQSLQITSDTTGIAVIKYDGFRIQVSFDFEAHKDSYGVPGSDFTAVEITCLTVDQITNTKGELYKDFTDYNDHRNINLLLAGFIEKNKLVEAV